MTHSFDTFATPLGPFSVAVNDHGCLVATAFGTKEKLRQRFEFCHLMDDKNAARSVREQVLAYFAGELRIFEVPLSAQGTPFQNSVWSHLQRIPFGETRTYGQIAATLGSPAAARAVGRANATNPICLIVPCHRVIGADGSLTGFAFGEEIKCRLIEHEREIAMRTRAA